MKTAPGALTTPTCKPRTSRPFTATPWSVAVALALALPLSACGGGGGSGVDTPAPPQATGPALPAVDVSTVAAQDTGSPLAADWHRGAFMQIFVRSYQDSDGDGKGDLQGLISRLDYLKDLGVTGLWLMPVARSQDHDHGYAVTDYRNIEADYGSLVDMDALIAQAHARGIGVVLDYVMNHSAAQHPLFTNASSARTNAWRDWYVWQDSVPAGWSVWGGNPWRPQATGAYYAPFWDQMPDFNLRSAAVENWHASNLRFWLNRGVDGFRFDAVGVLIENGPDAWNNQPENKALMNRMQAVVQSYTRRTMVCEAPDDPLGFAASTGCGNAFAFDLAPKLLNAARGNTTAMQAVLDYASSAPAGMATFLSNHDGFAGSRVWQQLGGNVPQYKLAAAIHLMLPGTPYVYYGEEIGLGLGQGLSGDAALRSPMSWTADTTRGGFTTGQPYRALAANVASQNVAAQTADSQSLLNHYKALLNLRKDRASLRTGAFSNALVSGNVMQWQRTQGTQRSLVLINTGTTASTVSVASLGANAVLTALQNPAGASTPATASASGTASITVPAQSLLLLDVAQP
ncbi:MAG: alpha-amylase [Burkholderiales bacterium PBB6]|nr:MAG: alpha-amylase [Burkholderiales bacterium PBB6]